MPMIHGMADVVRELRKTSDCLGILTSNMAANVETFLDAHGLLDHFDFISSTSKLTGKAKHLKAIRKTFSLRQEEMLYVGDEIRDIKASRKAGVHVAAVTWGFNSRESLAAEKPDYLLDHPGEFLSLARP
jgi:HAD superfamily hydrolase (TIGR01549 family)